MVRANGLVHTMHAYVCVCVCVCAHVYACMYVYMYMYMNMHMNMYMNMYMYMYMPVKKTWKLIHAKAKNTHAFMTQTRTTQVTERLIAAYGWRGALQWLAVGTGILNMSSALTFASPKPRSATSQSSIQAANAKVAHHTHTVYR